MKLLLEQLVMLRGGAHAIETAMPALADDCDEQDAQHARDLIITTRRHLNAIEEELGLPEPMPLRVMEPDYVPVPRLEPFVSLGDNDSAWGLAGGPHDDRTPAWGGLTP